MAYYSEISQVKNGGRGVNRTVEQILLESPLVQTYQTAQCHPEEFSAQSSHCQAH